MTKRKEPMSPSDPEKGLHDGVLHFFWIIPIFSGFYEGSKGDGQFFKSIFGFFKKNLK